MSGDVHVRFREHLRGQFPRVTRLLIGVIGSKSEAKKIMKDVVDFVETELHLEISK